MNGDEEELEVDVPTLDADQKARNCRIEGDKVVCPPPKRPEQTQEANVEDGTVEATIGRQEVTSISCKPHKKTKKLSCITMSTQKD